MTGEMKRWVAEPANAKGFLASSYEAWEDIATKAHAEFVSRRNERTHWTPPAKSLGESRVALLTTGGVHHRDSEPFDLASHSGDQSVRRIPDDVDTRRLVVSHSHYNHGDADNDINCVLPLDRLHEAVAEGEVGSSAPTHYGLMGFAPDARRFVDETAPEIIANLQAEDVDIVVLSPG
jgi:D-proline reductase (dithiol) PrdB